MFQTFAQQPTKKDPAKIEDMQMRTIKNVAKAKSRMPELQRHGVGIDNEDLLANSVIGTFESLLNHSPRDASFDHQNSLRMGISAPHNMINEATKSQPAKPNPSKFKTPKKTHMQTEY